MSSPHQDHLLAEGPEPVSGTGSTPAPARRNSRRTVGTAEKKDPSSVPTQRQGKAQRSGSTSTSTTTTKAATAKAATAKAATAKAATAKAATAAAPAQRPTPHKRPAAPATVAAQPVIAEPVITEPVAAEPVAAEAAAVVAALAGGRRRGAHRRPPSPRRRPALYLAAGLVGAMSIGAFSAGNPDARAETASHSASVAQLLGVHAQPETVTSADAGRLGELAASRNQRGAEAAAAAHAQNVADQKAVDAARPKAVLPVKGARLTSTFGMRWGTLHAGIDLAAPLGTPEYAAMDGVVLKAGPASGFGLAVYIQHANGDVTVYGHMEKILVTDGQVVRAGDTIALLGAEGEATGPHLHFEVHVGGIMGQKIDPLPWLRERGVSI
ncbi:MAG: M23 family metallopeptidase [Blastococcus sp.]